MNTNYETAVNAVKSNDKSTGSMWKGLALFVGDVCANDLEFVVGTQGFSVKPVFKREERQATEDHTIEMAKNSSYRVQKALLVKAVALGLCVLRSAGVPKGKTELEEEVATFKVDKSAFEKFKTALATAEKLSPDLLAKDRVLAATLVQELLDVLVPLALTT